MHLKTSLKTIRIYYPYAVKCFSDKINMQFFDSKGKKVVKGEVFKNAIDERSPKGMIGSLPLKWELEKKIVIARPNCYNIQGYETKSIEEYKMQQKIILESKELNKCSMVLYQNINEVLLHESPNRYAHLFTDYCNSFDSNKETIEYVIRNKVLILNGILWITVSTRGKIGETKERLFSLIKKTGKDNYVFEKIDGDDIYQYQGSENGKYSTMLSTILRRVK